VRGYERLIMTKLRASPGDDVKILCNSKVVPVWLGNDFSLLGRTPFLSVLYPAYNSIILVNVTRQMEGKYYCLGKTEDDLKFMGYRMLTIVGKLKQFT